MAYRPRCRSGNRDKSVRVQAELRPDVLHINTTMIEFREWLATFKLYLYSSNLQNDDISRQQAIYKQLLDPELRRRVAPECGADTPVFTLDPNPNNIAALIDILEAGTSSQLAMAPGTPG